MMHLRIQSRLTSWTAALILASTFAHVPQTHAQQSTWKPDKPVELVIGATSGGSQDRTGRMMQAILQDLRLVPTLVNIVNKPGGSGAAALSYLAQHPGDAHSLAITSISILTNPIVGRSTMQPTEFTPIAVMGSEYIGIFVRADSPLKTGKDMVELLRKQPTALSVAVGLGPATTLHIAYALAMKTAGIDIKKLKTVGFSSGGQATAAVLGGHIDATVATPSNMLAHMNEGRIRMIVVGAPTRLTGELSHVPTWTELGLRGTYELWRGIAGPKGMTRPQLQYWDDTLAKVVKSKLWLQDIESSHMVNSYRNSSETATYWKQEYEAAKAILTELGFAK